MKIKSKTDKAAKAYQDRLALMIKTYSEIIENGGKIDICEVDCIFDDVEPDGDNTKLQNWLAKVAGVKASEFAKAIRLKRIRDELGRIPGSAADLVECYVTNNSVTMTYDETISRAIRPFLIDVDGKQSFIGEHLFEDPEFALYIECNFPKTIDRLQFQRILRMISDKVKLGFSDRSIEDAVEAWMETAKLAAKHEIISEIDACPIPKRLTEADWHKLCEAIFDCSEHGVEFVTAVLRHFIWQTKRKLRGALPEHHLMPVIIGKQGSGKSTFVNKLLRPIAPLTLLTNFDMVTDDRVIDIWKSAVLFFDEMQNAGSADVEAIKNLITAAKITRRPMRSNGQMTFVNHATFIGCSNKTLGQLIRDETGMRRFAELRYRDDADRNFVNDVEWHRLWQSVDHRSAAPILAVMDKLAAQQEASRQKSRVETWLEAVVNDTEDYGDDGDGFREGSAVAGHMLFQRFKLFEETFFPGNAFRTNVTAWGLEMGRIISMGTVGEISLVKRRDKGGIMYRIERADGTPLREASKVVSISDARNRLK